MPDEITIRLQVHRQNIARYRALLKTELIDIERAFIDRRIAEEDSEVRRLSALAPGDESPKRPEVLFRSIPRSARTIRVTQS